MPPKKSAADRILQDQENFMICVMNANVEEYKLKYLKKLDAVKKKWFTMPLGDDSETMLQVVIRYFVMKYGHIFHNAANGTLPRQHVMMELLMSTIEKKRIPLLTMKQADGSGVNPFHTAALYMSDKDFHEFIEYCDAYNLIPDGTFFKTMMDNKHSAFVNSRHHGRKMHMTPLDILYNMNAWGSDPSHRSTVANKIVSAYGMDPGTYKTSRRNALLRSHRNKGLDALLADEMTRMGLGSQTGIVQSLFEEYARQGGYSHRAPSAEFSGGISSVGSSQMNVNNSVRVRQAHKRTRQSNSNASTSGT